MAAATALCLAVVLTGYIGRGAGLAFVLALLGYVVFAIRTGAAVEPEANESRPRMGVAIVLFLAGLVVTVIGARALVIGAVSLAGALGVSEAVIGLTVVAIGTSLPELATSVIAARKGQADLAFGNILGSNIFNILGILGVTALVQPLAVPPEIAGFDIWVMVAATVALVVAAVTGWRISRREGVAFVLAYLAYLGWLVWSV